MLIYLLLAVTCSMKEPSKTFNLTCKPAIQRFYTNEAECMSQIQSTKYKAPME